MPVIKLTPEDLISGAKLLRDCASKNEAVLKELDSLIANLALDWEGEAQRAFTNSYETKKATFKSFTEDMQRLTGELERFAQTMQDQENLQKAKAESLA